MGLILLHYPRSVGVVLCVSLKLLSLDIALQYYTGEDSLDIALQYYTGEDARRLRLMDSVAGQRD